MARPRVFVSSTYYDLKHIRASLELFIESLGFEPVLSEKGEIAYSPELPLDESCYREAASTDIYVLVVGGRYGSEISATHKVGEKTQKAFYERYESITKREYSSANSKGVPVYVLIERSVYAEYQTFRHNRANQSVSYAHVDSVNIFSFIDELIGQPFNNPIQTFEKFSEMETWLREQWAGLFRDLLNRRSEQRQLSTLSSEVKQLSELNTTLKRYLETLLKASNEPGSEQVIQQESKRLDEAMLRRNLESTGLFLVIQPVSDKSKEEFIDIFLRTTSFKEFLVALGLSTEFRAAVEATPNLSRYYQEARELLDQARGGLPVTKSIKQAPTQK